MTFALLRAGLPNTVVAIALAMLPVVTLALSPARHAPPAPAQPIEPAVVRSQSPDRIASTDPWSSFGAAPPARMPIPWHTMQLVLNR